MGSFSSWARVVALAAACGCGGFPVAPDVAGSAPDHATAITMLTSSEVAPAWSIGYGDEFWRGSARFDGAIERVSHAIRRDTGNALPAAETATFTATFDGLGVRFSPHSSAAVDSSAELRLRTTRVAIGDHAL